MWLQRILNLTSPSPSPFSCLVCVLLYSAFSFQCLSIPSADALPSHPPLLNPLGLVSFPVYHERRSAHTDDPHHRHRHHARRILDPSLAASNPFSTSPTLSAPPPPSTSRNVPELRSDLITLSEPLGQFFAELQIGTPAKDIAVIIDTGSELMWIQCTPCLQCGHQAKEFPIFDPAKSSSFQSLSCNADICQGDDAVTTGCTDSSSCTYSVSYGDKSNSSGSLSQETLTFTIANDASTGTSKGGSSFTLTQFVFGCGIDNVGVEARLNASGLMGLSRGAYSVISQLGVDVFSYCLPNRANSVDVSGYLTFGTSASAAKPSLQYTPIIQNDYSAFLSQFYYLNLTGVSFNGQLLDIPAVAFEIDAGTGSGGTIIDSGTTLTTFVDEAYEVILQAFESYIGTSYKKLDLEENSTMVCYEVPLSKQTGPPAVPKVALHFEGSADMVLGTDHLFHLYASDTTNNYYCLTIASGGTLASGAKNFIGNYQQQDFLVEYDLANSRLGFAPTQCSTTSNGPSLLKPMWYFTLSFTFLLLFL